MKIESKSSDLRLTLQRKPGAPRSQVTLSVENTSGRLLNLNLGRNTNPVFVTLTVRSKAGTLHWSFVEGGIAPGRTDPFVFSLPAEASISLPLDLAKFAAAPNYEGLKALPFGVYRVEATFQGQGVDRRSLSPDAAYFGMLPYWTGTSVSAPLRLLLP